MYVDIIVPNRPIEGASITSVDTVCKDSGTEWIHKQMLDIMLSQPPLQKIFSSLFQI